MKLTIEIKADNAAFQPQPGIEIGRLLRILANRIEVDTLFCAAAPIGDDLAGWNIADNNGNSVGRVDWS